MKKIFALSFVFILAFVTSCKSDKKENDNTLETETENTETTSQKPYNGEPIWVELNSKSGSTASGNVIFEKTDNGVSMVAAMFGLEPGEHAMHLHEKSDCSSEDGKSAGGHWNPTNQPHGKWGSPEGYHKGDIGNFTVSDDGKGTYTLSTNEWCIGCGDETKDILGKAVIIHQGTDDYTTQPTGAAGGRISCGGIIQ